MIKIFTLPEFYKCTNTVDNFNSFYFELLNKALSLFEWENLPENIDNDMIEFFLLTRGHIAFFKSGDKLHATFGTPSDTLDENYTFTKYLITNPYISDGETFNLTVGSECIVVYNTPCDKVSITKSVFSRSLRRTAGILADNMSSLNCLQINSRVQTMVTADNSTIAKSAESVLKEMYDGKPYKVITSTLANNIDIENKSNVNSNTFSELINLNNYMYAQYLHSIGIKSNESAKKERLITAEIDENDTECQINLNQMLKSRKKAVEKINKLFDTNIEVKLNEILTNGDKKDDSQGSYVTV